MAKDAILTEAEAAEALLAALVDDLDTGFVELVHKYQRVVFSVALRVTGKVTESEELSAESFLRAYLALRGYAPSRIRMLQPRPWLLTIMLNTWRNTVRSAARHPQTPMAEVPERPTVGPSVEEQVVRGETRRELAELLARLPENQRVAVTLRHVVGLPMVEIATVMNIPEGTAKSHTSRGLTTLRDLCGDQRPTGSETLFNPAERPKSRSRREPR